LIAIKFYLLYELYELICKTHFKRGKKKLNFEEKSLNFAMDFHNSFQNWGRPDNFIPKLMSFELGLNSDDRLYKYLISCSPLSIEEMHLACLAGIIPHVDRSATQSPILVKVIQRNDRQNDGKCIRLSLLLLLFTYL
jgi:hypothetical protein